MRVRDSARSVLRMLLLVLAPGALVGVGACGARSSTIADDEVDCAVERQRVYEECKQRCGVAQSPMRRTGTTRGRKPNDPTSTEPTPTPCIDDCIAATQRQCETTATCRCADSLLTAAGD